MSKKRKQIISAEGDRDYLFDNLRAFFIILVVWGHLLTSMKGDYTSIRSIYIFLFFFHMQAMTFISGYFSKNLEKIRSNAFATIFIPYLILNVCMYLYNIFILHVDYFGIRLLRPYWGMWYLLALFIWKFFLKDLIKIHFLLPFSIILAVLCGFSGEFSEYLALSRLVCFLPFFLLGYYCSREHIDKIRRLPKLLCVGVILAVAVIAVGLARSSWFSVEILFLRGPYDKDAEIRWMLCRILIFVLAAAMIMAITNLMTDRKMILSYIGRSTMTVYVLHLFTIPILEKLELFKNQPYIYLIYSVFMTALIIYLYTLPIVKRTYDFIMTSLEGLILCREHGVRIH